MAFFDALQAYEDEIGSFVGLAIAGLALYTMVRVLALKREPTSALAWCLLIMLLPLFGPLFFLLFGYQNVQRPLERKKKQRLLFRARHVARPQEGRQREDHAGFEAETLTEGMGRLAGRFDAFPMTAGNDVTIFNEGKEAFTAMLDHIRTAQHHIHLEFFIFQPDATGRSFLELLAAKARSGVEVRMIYDPIGSHRLASKDLEGLRQSGGEAYPFLPVSVLRHRFQINLRNHRKILVVDGRVGFVGGLNIGDEYLGKVLRFGYWRDTHLLVMGPAVESLQRVFLEDWNFASNGQELRGGDYYPPLPDCGGAKVQVIHSGPDQPYRSIRQVYFAAFLRARKRLWIASPYFVPDSSLQDALKLAAYLGVDVRLLCLQHPDKWIPYFAARYYWSDMLAAGVKIYQYQKGMMHSKVVLVDGQWASVGTANLDNRSMFLNFEVNCMLYDERLVGRLEAAFLNDLQVSRPLELRVYQQRSFAGRLIENVCRLASPVL